MKRYRSYRRSGGVYYVHDTVTGRRESLKTKSADEAERLVQARNEATGQTMLNRQLARTYLAACDPEANERTWSHAFEWIIRTKHGPTQERWRYASRQKAFGPLLDKVIVETRAEDFLKVMDGGGISANLFLKRLHNFVLGMGWLPSPILPKLHWPSVSPKTKRAITAEEHARIIERERNPEWNAYYRMCWLTGGSQTDVAKLIAEDVDWSTGTLSYHRSKTKSVVRLAVGSELAGLLRSLPRSGPLFPRISQLEHRHRAKLFHRRCHLLGIKGVSLHSYRYAWAQRARQAGYPERYAQEALGHASQAVARAYSKGAYLVCPPLDDFESKIIPFDKQDQAARRSADP